MTYSSRGIFGLVILLLSTGTLHGSDRPTPTDVTFHWESHRQRPYGGGDGHGDNWCQTWAADDSIVTFADDGLGWVPRSLRTGRQGPYRNGYSCRLWRLIDQREERIIEDLPNQPDYWRPTKWFGFGLISVDGTFYGTITHVGGPGRGWSRPFNGFKMIVSTDNGTSWSLHDGRPLAPSEDEGLSRSIEPADNFFWHVDPKTITDRRGVTETGYAFTSVYPVQCGRDNSLAQDSYVYWYAPDVPAHRLNLARVPKDRIADRSAWEYFERFDDDVPVWTDDVTQRGAVVEYPSTYQDLVACWRGNKPSVVYNPGLDRYLMINWIEYKTAYWNRPRIHDELGVKSYAMSMAYADNPYGPWTEFFWDPDFRPGGRDYSIYHPQLSPKWISEDGRTMTMVFTSRSAYGVVGDLDAYVQPQQADYAWNEMTLTIQTDAD